MRLYIGFWLAVIGGLCFGLAYASKPIAGLHIQGITVHENSEVTFQIKSEDMDGAWTTIEDATIILGKRFWQSDDYEGTTTHNVVSYETEDNVISFDTDTVDEEVTSE